jgi:glycosyltransferase involved in cell wall biosynthesis
MHVGHQENLNSSNPLLSIIIPCFNSEKYILEALNSLLQIKSISIEIIIINDGSSDKTRDYIENFISQNKSSINARFFNQFNQGVSAARNLGLKKANGFYIGFLDSDDIFLNGFDALVLPIISHHNPDIIEFGFKQFFEEKDLNEVAFKPIHQYKGEYKIGKILTDIYATTVWYSPIRIYKKSLWKNIQYPLAIEYSEDSMTLPKVFQNARSIFYIDKPLYGYRQYAESASSNHSIKHLRGLIDFYWRIDEEDQASKILKIRLARGISFFAFELKALDSGYLKIRRDILSIRIGVKMCKKLLFPDLLYFLFPRIYDFINKLRLN